MLRLYPRYDGRVNCIIGNRHASPLIVYKCTLVYTTTSFIMKKKKYIHNKLGRYSVAESVRV